MVSTTLASLWADRDPVSYPYGYDPLWFRIRILYGAAVVDPRQVLRMDVA